MILTIPSISGLVCAVALSAAAALAARPSRLCAPMPQPDHGHARVRLVSEHAALVPGTTATLGFTFDIDPGWHLYWNGRNETGFPPEAALTLPPALEACDVQWSAPKRHISPGNILDHIYEKQVTLLLPVRVSPDAKPGEKLTVKASLEWLVCEEACIPGSGEVELTLPVAAAGAKPAVTPEARLFEQARARLPRPRRELPPGVIVNMTLESGAAGARFEARMENAEWMAFYPAAECSPPTDAIHECEAKSDRLVVNLEAGDEARVIGVLEARIRGRDAPLFYEVRYGKGVETKESDGE